MLVRKGKEMPLVKCMKPKLDVKFFEELLKTQEQRMEAERKQKEQELELLAGRIAEKVAEKLRELNK